MHLQGNRRNHIMSRMRILQFNSVGGASGDMILGALVDLGADLDAIRAALTALPLEEFSLTTEAASHSGLYGTRLTVHAPESTGHSHHHHNHDHGHHHHHAPHRHYSDIVTMLESSDLPENIVIKALEVFRCIAEAEASVHNTTPEKIHFHEVGALDSIVDIVGCTIALEQLQVDAVAIDSLPVGTGTTTCAHGTMPLPVPATAEILSGFPIVQTDEPFELVTPTGAALLRTWSTMRQPPAGAMIRQTAHGFGQRELEHRPNLLRAILLETDESPHASSCVMLETCIDDTSPELIGTLTDDLLAAGALDVFTSPVFMKKQRQAVLLSTLCTESTRAALEDMIFEGSTTFGIRHYPVNRTILDRRHETVDTAFGEIRIKIGSRNGKDLTASPEFEDCRTAAAAHNISIRRVYEAARTAFEQQPNHGDSPS